MRVKTFIMLQISIANKLFDELSVRVSIPYIMVSVEKLFLTLIIIRISILQFLKDRVTIMMLNIQL